MKPTLIIGIGGSGMKIGHRIKFMLDKFTPERLEPSSGDKFVNFLFFDNDISETGRLLTDIGNISTNRKIINPHAITGIDGFNPDKLIDYMEKGDSDYTDMSKWLDTTLHFPNVITSDGLQQNRQLGRMAFYVNKKKLMEKLDKAIRQLQQLQANKVANNADISIYVIASICGGTGSSFYLDLVTMIQSIMNIGHQANIKAVFINPNYFIGKQESDENKLNIKYNAYALISECEYFAKNKNLDNKAHLAKFSANPSDYKEQIKTEGYRFEPFRKAILFDIYTDKGNQIPAKSFFSNLGDILFYSLNSESSTTWESLVETNKKNETNEVNYGTIAYRTIRYPSEEFKDYLKTRMKYELFDKVLLREDYNKDIVEEMSRRFVAEIFQDSEGKRGVRFDRLEEDFKQSWFKNSKVYTLMDSGADRFKNGDLLIEYSDLENVLLTDKERINDLSTQADKILKDMLSEFKFDKEYDQRGSMADKLRMDLWKMCYKVVKECGYYGVVGSLENGKHVSGFVEQVCDRLKGIFRDLGTEITRLVNQRKVLENGFDALGKELQTRCAKGGFMSRKKKFNSVESLVIRYDDTLRSIAENISKETLLRLKQWVLYYFAVGDDSNVIGRQFDLLQGGTDLGKYLSGLLRVMMSDTNQGVLTMEKGELHYQFNEKLKQRFLRASNDVFTYIIPARLDSYLDDNGWKVGTDLDVLYTNNINVVNLFGEIFPFTDNDTTPIKNIARIGEGQNHSPKNVVDQVDSYFDSTIMQISSVNDFVEQNIEQALQKLQNNIDDPEQYANLIQDLLSIPKPLNFEGGLSDGLFANVPAGQSYIKAVEDILQIPADKIIENRAQKDNLIVLLSYVSEINWHRISGNDLIKEAFQDRNKKFYRPHLNREWNDYQGGISEWANNAKAREENLEFNMSLTLSVKELLFLSMILDSIQQDVDPTLSGIYITDTIKINAEHLLCRPPVYFDKDNQWKFIPLAELDVSSKPPLFALMQKNGSNQDTMVTLKLGSENIEFEHAINTLREKRADLNHVFSYFIKTVHPRSKEFKEILSKQESKERILKLCDVYKDQLIKMSNDEIKASSGNVLIVDNLIKDMNALLMKLFDFKLY